MNKVLVILGPTASGKSDLAVALAVKFNGEVVSADSRQVYRGMDLGTGKITKREMKRVPHHLLDVANPKRVYSVAQYQKEARTKIKEILARGKLPIICGGTGFYIQSLVDGIVLPEVPPNAKLRKELEKKTVAQLFAMLKKLDPRRAEEIDAQNPHRLIRAIEIAKYLGAVPKLKVKKSDYDFLQIGIKIDMEKLREKIEKRLVKRLKQGMFAEVKKLRTGGLSWKRLEGFGLEYRYLARFLQNKISKTEMMNQLTQEIINYAKRQMTWFKRDQRINWIVKPQEAEKLMRKFI